MNTKKGGSKMSQEQRLLDANYVAFLVGISVETLDNWYKFKRQNPDNEYAQLLPNITYMNPEKDTARQKSCTTLLWPTGKAMSRSGRGYWQKSRTSAITIRTQMKR